MPRNGSGTYERVHNWTDDAGAGIPIEASRMDAEDDSIAQALTDSIAKDGQTTPTANLPMGGYAHTSVGNATARNQYAAVGQVQDSAFNYATTGGSSNAYTLGVSPSITAYAAGQRFIFNANHSNSGAATLNVSGLGTKAIQRPDGSALSASDITSGQIYDVTYNGTAFVLAQTVVSAASTTVAGIVELATDAETQTGSDTDRAVTPAGLQSKVASDSAIGLVELATDAETITGTATDKVCTPANIQAKVASTTALGIVELATDAEAAAGTATDKVLTPSNKASLGILDDGQDASAGNITLALTDANKRVTNNSASTRTVTVPPNSSVAFSTGTVIILYRDGAGSFTVVAGGGVTINKASTLTLALRAQHSYAFLVKDATDTWSLGGDTGT